MLTLFYKPSCPFCQRVLGEIEDMGIQLNLRDTSSDLVAADELLEKGGKPQVPYLIDEDRGISMYESGDIITYLEENYRGEKVAGDSACESCQ
jgi:glutaredoxin 3